MVNEIAQVLLLEEVPDDLLLIYRKALESHDEPMVVISLNGKVRYLNHEACKLLGVIQREVLDKQVDEVERAWHADFKSMLDRVENGEKVFYFQIDGNNYVCDVMSLSDRLGKRVGILQVVRPETVQNSREGIDMLTGLYERSRFCSATRRLLDQHPEEDYVLVYWNVIRFKNINEVFSMETGDTVLKNIAKTIRSIAGNEGTCGRFLEDQFAFCVPKRLLNEDWLARNSEVTLISDTAMYTFNSSYGVYEITDRGLAVDEMCERAVLAQSYVKESDIADGVCFAYYNDDMGKRMEESRELTSQLSFALAENQIQAYYQPIYDIGTGEVSSAEALARWVHPEKGLISPARFIRLFESNGMVAGLDKHLWTEVAEFLEKRLADDLPVVPISVNVSRVDFFSPTLIDELEEIMSAHNLPHHLLRLEVTESAYVDDPMRIRETVEKLRSLGYTVLIDDFGSGYSSLNTVKDIPIDILKLDMDFLRNFETSHRSKCIIENIVAMVHQLGFKVVAEGVETQEQADFLRSIDCHFAQGYLYARPLPAADFAALLDETPVQGY